MAKTIRLVQEDCTCALVPTDAWRDGLYAVMYCDMHAAAPEMLEFVQRVAQNETGERGDRARALLAKIDAVSAEGRESEA